MHIVVTAKDFLDQPLTLKPARIGRDEAADDYVVMCAGRPVARVMKVAKSFGRHAWDWHITGPYFRPEMGGTNGSENTLDEAKQVVRKNFDRWLAWVNVHPSDAVWHQ